MVRQILTGTLLGSLLIVAVSGVAVAQTPAPDCTSGGGAAPALPATIPIELHSNHVSFWVCRGDKPLMFVLDTGAGTSFFDLGIARSLGVELGARGFRASGGGAGSAVGAHVRRDSVRIAGTSITAGITQAIDFSGIAGPEGALMQGILGADFISRYIVALDYRQMHMRLYDRDTFTYDGPGTSVPFTLKGAFIHVRGELQLADSGVVSGDFVIDVGSGLALALAKPFVERHGMRERVGPTVRRPSGRGVGGPIMAHVARVPRLRIGGVEVNAPIAYLYGDSAGVFSGASLGDGNIGGEILRRFTVYFDYRARRMIWERHDATNEPFEVDMSGVQLGVLRDGSGLSVEFVVAASPAAGAGLTKGDVVVAIDGKSANAGALEGLRKRFRRSGERVAFTIRRDGRRIVIEFVTRRLV